MGDFFGLRTAFLIAAAAGLAGLPLVACLGRRGPGAKGEPGGEGAGAAANGVRDDGSASPGVNGF